MSGGILDGIELVIDREAVVVAAHHPLTVISSAVVGGGFVAARAIVNLHIGKDASCEDAEQKLEAFVRCRGITRPYVGLLTSAWTEKAEVARASGDVAALAVATVGLGNPVAAGRSAVTPRALSTINTIIVVDADPEPAALVNAVITATEVKALLMMEAGIRCPDGRLASGTSTDAVVVAATGRGPRCRFGGPISDLGWAVAQVTRDAIDEGVRRWLAEHA